MPIPPDAVPRKEVPLLVLDIDGTVRHGLDQLGRFVNGPEDVVLFPEALDRMRQWKTAGGRIIGVSNQGGVALGKLTRDDAHAAMARTMDLACGENGEQLFETICWCHHHPSVPPACWCRKPRTALIVQALNQVMNLYGTEVYPPTRALMIGDRNEDKLCAESAGIAFLQAETWRDKDAEMPRVWSLAFEKESQ